MNYPRVLDEYSDDEPLDEIKRRQKAREKGRCDCCRQARTAQPCRFPERHREKA